MVLSVIVVLVGLKNVARINDVDAGAALNKRPTGIAPPTSTEAASGIVAGAAC